MGARLGTIARVDERSTKDSVGVRRELLRIPMMQAIQRLDDRGAVADA